MEDLKQNKKGKYMINWYKNNTMNIGNIGNWKVIGSTGRK